MTIHLRPDLEALLKMQVDLGNYPSIEAALEAAVRAFAEADTDLVPEDADLSWAKPYLEEADRDIAEGRVRPHGEVWADIEKRFGGTKR